MSGIDLSAVSSRRIKTNVLEAAYGDGFTGCFLPGSGGEEGAMAAKARDEFRDDAGENGYRFTDAMSHLESKLCGGFNGIDGCHVYSAYAFEQFKQYGAGFADTLYRMLQNSGNCVGASWKEMMDDLLGKQSKDSSNAYRMLACCSMIVYAYRSGCGQGWYMGTCASQAKRYGWLPAVIFDGRKLGQLTIPDYGNMQMDDEQELENAAVRTWCNGRVPDVIENWMANNFQYENGAISELNDTSVDAIMRTGELQGCIHHGSNYTAASGGMDRVRRIGGHAQTSYGVDASDQAIDFFKRRGINISKDNPIMPQGQTWGGGWSGEVDDENWPFGTDETGHVYTWAEVQQAVNDPNWLQDIVSNVESAGGWGWGPKHQGAWLVTLSTFRRYFSGSAYVYLPRFQGIPTDYVPDPPTPDAEHPEMTGNLFGEQDPTTGRISIRGNPTLTIKSGQEPGTYKYNAAPVPQQPGRYTLVPKIL